VYNGSIITVSGARLSPVFTVDTIPVEDVAIALGRITLLNGHTTEHVTALHESIFRHQVALARGMTYVEALSAMTLNFYQAFTGLIPSLFQNNGYRILCSKMDDQVLKSMQIPRKDGGYLQELDYDVGKAIAACWGPPGYLEDAYQDHDVDPQLMRFLRYEYDRTGDTINGRDSFGVRRLISMYNGSRSNVGLMLSTATRSK